MQNSNPNQNIVSVEDFIENFPVEKRKRDAIVILKLMKEITGKEPKMWGPTTIGFGEQHYKFPSGREGDTFEIGFSPRKPSTSLYLYGGFSELRELLSKLGKHKSTGYCLYINNLEDIDLDILKKILQKAYKNSKLLAPSERKK